MKLSETTIKTISHFEDNLVRAFRKMILGVNVTLSEKGEGKYKEAGIYEGTGQTYFIVAINEDETITLEGKTKYRFTGLKLNDIIL
jgi:hypothetical protein